jgi:hypothetical protein
MDADPDPGGNTVLNKSFCTDELTREVKGVSLSQSVPKNRWVRPSTLLAIWSGCALATIPTGQQW